MFARFWRAGGWLLVLAVVALAAAPANAAREASPAGQGPGGAGGLYNWYTLAPGSQAEWVFQYLGDNEQAAVVLGENPANAIVMNVYNNEQWRALGAGDLSIQPVGKGTAGTLNNWQSNKDVIKAGNLFWEAYAKPPVTFHVQVVNTSQQPAQYWIAQIGVAAGGLSAASPPGTVATPQPAQPAPSALPATQGQPGTAATQASPAQAPGTQVPAPHTLPVSGSSELSWPFGAGAALTAAGWLLRRRAR